MFNSVFCFWAAVFSATILPWFMLKAIQTKNKGFLIIFCLLNGLLIYSILMVALS
jgi:hypothetical protein